MFGNLYGDITVRGPQGNDTSFKDVAALDAAIKNKTKVIADLKAKRAKTKLFSKDRATLTKLINAEQRYLAALKRAMLKEKRGSRRRHHREHHRSPASVIAKVQAAIQQKIAAGADPDAAEEEAKRTLLPPGLIASFPRGFFRGVRRAGPRPALPETQIRHFRPMPGELPGPTRDIDPRVFARDIDPRVFARGIDPNPLVRGIDPIVGGTGLIPQAGAFTFPPGNLTDIDPDVLDDSYEGILDTVKDYAGKPWVMGLALIGAVVYGPKLLRKAKSALKMNPRRRRRKHNRRRRSHR